MERQINMKTMDDLDKDYLFFFTNIEELYSKYGHKFLAIKDKRVLGAYDTFKKALEETIKTDKIGTFLVQECFKSKKDTIGYFQTNVLFKGEPINV
jgi:phosphopentomutase